MNKIQYSTNWMGPINKKWCDENGTDWAGGRIDIYGDEDSPYGNEIGLPVMKTSDWNRFSAWLDDIETPTILSLKELLHMYYNEGNPKITWFNYNE